MRKRLIQVLGFLISTFGWLFVSCTLAMDYWRILYVGGKGGNWMVKASWYWSNLWKDCVTDMSSISDCRDYDALWAVTPYVQAVRGLLMIAMGLGFIAAILCFIGMECTYIGGSEKNKRRVLLAGAALHFAGGLSAAAAYCLYTNRVARAAFAPAVDTTIIRYGIGAPVFFGLVGSFLIILGSALYAVTHISTRKKTVSVGRTLYTRPSYGRRTASKTAYTSAYSAPSRQSSSRLSRMSQATDEKLPARDTFV
ncbi:claudin 10-like 2 [Danio rerio]|uniref:Claudin 10-like 2 n=1 Tax=Danio rerio TaxID=7955 RepID=A0AB12ZNB8_DANRE|nr:claudin 10-like 2 [Danio rerio]|eukprot:XP_005167454.1 claudin-10 [Danio rerio]